MLRTRGTFGRPRDSRSYRARRAVLSSGSRFARLNGLFSNSLETTPGWQHNCPAGNVLTFFPEGDPVNGHEKDRQPEPPETRAWKWALPAVALVLAVTTILGWVTLSQERQRGQELVARNAALETTLHRLEGQLNGVSHRLGELNAAVDRMRRETDPTVQTDIPIVVDRSVRRATTTARKSRPASPPRDPRVDQLQNRVASQEKELENAKQQLASTRDQLTSTRDELSGELGSTRTELSGAIARTHEELVELQKRGERNYYEFDLFKNKEFSRVGPVGISLRKADTRRQRYQMKLRVDDREIEKKDINLYEPMWLSTPDAPQPIQLVVNEITKDRVRGYISEPRFKRDTQALNSTPSQRLTNRE